MQFHHVPVLFDEVMEWITPQPDGVYADGTLGGGGHSEGILRLSGGSARLYGIDRDPEAIAAASERLKHYPGFRAIHGNFHDAKNLLAEAGAPALNGALLDLGVYVLNFASMVLGDDIQEIKGLCTYCDTGVDCQESITITYSDGKMAALTASMLTASHRLGLIYGTKGYIHCININNIQGFEVYDLNHNLVKTVEVPRQINGYEYEVLACKKALEEGALECPEMPHSETVRMMEWMDKLRSDWGVRFPFEA